MVDRYRLPPANHHLAGQLTSQGFWRGGGAQPAIWALRAIFHHSATLTADYRCAVDEIVKVIQDARL